MEYVRLFLSNQAGAVAVWKLVAAGIAMVIFLFGLGIRVLKENKGFNDIERKCKISAYFFVLAGSLIMYGAMWERIQSIFTLLCGCGFMGIGMILFGHGVKWEKETMESDGLKYRISYKTLLALGWTVVLLTSLLGACLFVKQQ